MIDDHAVRPTVEMESSSQPPRAACRRAWPNADVLNDHVMARMSMPPRMIVIPGEGAVWPAIGDNGSEMTRVFLSGQ